MMDGEGLHPTNPPEAWVPARRLAKAVLGPIERFLKVQAAGGIALLAAAAVAIVWANSPWHQSYEDLWHAKVAVALGPWAFEESLHFVINELLMTVFFLVVGLEIKRELVEGALADWRRAALPVAGALGGMIVPAAIFLALNPSGPASSAWAVPMATDIAFAVGVFTLLGTSVPPGLRILLLALAIIDDIGAILVIAVFYSGGVAVQGLLIAGAGLALLLILQQLGVRPGWGYAPPGILVWVGLLQAGVHPTIAGVLVGLAAPARSWLGKDGFLKVARRAVDDFEVRMASGAYDRELIEPLNQLSFAGREAISPALRMEARLHAAVAYVIMPMFALANAGVRLGGIDPGHQAFWPLVTGVTLGLVVGKPLGVVLASWLAVRLRMCALPPGVSWAGIFVTGSVAGIGFTMAIFITELAFADAALAAFCKLAILVASAAAATIGLVAGTLLLPREQPDEVARVSASELESSPEYWTGETAVPGNG